MIKLGVVGLILLLGLTVTSGLTSADSTKTQDQGLSISPAINYLDIKAGSTTSSSVNLYNNTSSYLSVRLLIKQFSVQYYSYNYVFATPTNNWLTLNQSQLQLAPGETTDVDYSISAPPSAAPGGSYFTILASTTFTTGNISSIGQAASLIYLTVDGKLLYSSKIVASNVQHFSFGSNINYSFTLFPKGNVYSYIYTYAHLGKITNTPVAHLIYPAAIRKINGQIDHPIIPGVYKITYGYKTSNNLETIKSSWVIYLPPWSVALVLFLLLSLSSLKFKSIGSKQRQ